MNLQVVAMELPWSRPCGNKNEKLLEKAVVSQSPYEQSRVSYHRQRFLLQLDLQDMQSIDLVDHALIKNNNVMSPMGVEPT